MQKQHLLTISLLAFTLLVHGATGFKAQFDSSLDATSPTGVVKAETSGGMPSFVKGRFSSQKAAHIDGDTSLCYPLSEEIYNVNNGILTFWFRPCNWGNGKVAPGEGHFQPLMAFDQEGGHNWTYLAFFAWDTKGGMKIQVQGRAKDNADTRHFQSKLPETILKPDTWNHIALTWNNMEFTAIINGEKIGTVNMGLPTQKQFNPKWRLWFCPRKFWKGALKGEYDIAGFELSDTIPSPEVIKRNYLNERAAEKSVSTMQAPVPLSSVPVVIDGRINDNEWRDATCLPVSVTYGDGMLVSDLGAQLFLKHDGKTFIYALKVKSTKTDVTADPDSNDIKVYSGEGCVLDFWWKLPDGEDCQLGIAPNRAWAFRRVKKWGTINHQRGGSTDKNGWYVECSIPFSEMGIEPFGTHEMNFCFTRPEYMKSAANRWVAWNTVEPRKPLSHNFGMLDFRHDNLAVRVSLQEGLNLGKLAFSLESNNSLEPKVSSDVPLTTTDTTQGIASTAAPAPGNHTLVMQVMQNGTQVYNAEYKYTVIEPLSFEATCHAKERFFDCHIDARGMDEAASADYLVTLHHDNDNSATLSKTTGKLADGQISCRLPFGELPKGDYLLNATITVGPAEGRQFSRSIRITKPDDIFLRERKGLERTIPWPFTEIKAQENTLTLTNITYTFPKDHPLPTTAVNRGVNVLASPVEFILQVNGKDDTLRPVSSSITESSKDRQVAEGLLKAENSPLTVAWKRTAAYDGMLKYQFTLMPQNKLTVNQFRITTTLKPEYARYCLSPIFQSDWETKGRFSTFPSAWLCGNPFGFTLFTDTDVNWIFNEEPLRMLKNPDGSATMAAHFIDLPTQVACDVPYTLAMMATPSKPPRPDWRTIHSEGWGRLVGQNLQIVMGGNAPQRFKRGQDLSQPITENILKLPEFFAARPAGVKRILPYVFLASLSDKNPIADWYGADWSRTVNGAPLAKSDMSKDRTDGTEYALLGIHLCHNKTDSADYLCYYLDKLLKDSDVFIGLYTDGGGIYKTDTPYPGMPDKPVLAMKKPPRTWELFGKRDLFERITKIIRANRGNKGIMFNHNWETYYPALLSFHDLIFPGEEYMHSIPRGMQVYIEDTPLGKWQSNYNSQVLGAGIQFLGQWRKLGGDLIRLPMDKRNFYTQPLLMMCLLHDTPLSGAWYPNIEPTWKLLDDNKICDATFTGYWQENALKFTNPNVKASLYQWKDRKEVMLILGNLSRAPEKVRIHGTLTDAYTGAPVPNLVELDGNFGFRILFWQ
ncbi:MAG: hypothetical protein IJT83_00795 [Victivallales bacterium]|nr:hypothetical protein [Victivallales bacterium]